MDGSNAFSTREPRSMSESSKQKAVDNFPSPRSSLLRGLTRGRNVPGGSLVAHVVVVGFHAKLGGVVEFAYPKLRGTVDLRSPNLFDSEDLTDEPQGSTPKNASWEDYPTTQSSTQRAEWGHLPQEWSLLPHLALPDGVHDQPGDVVFFRLPPDVHAVACFRQASASSSVVHHAARLHDDPTTASRGSIQKSVVVLCKRPIYGVLVDRLEAAVDSYFNQGDFRRTDLLAALYHSLNSSLSRPSIMNSSLLFHGLRPRFLVSRLGQGVLQIIKLILLERRVIVYGQPVRDASNAVITLTSLFPGALDTLSPGHEALEPHDEIERYGLPLKLFGDEDRVSLQPYATLPFLSKLLEKRQGCLIGTSFNVGILLKNSLRLNKSSTSLAVDALVDFNSGEINFGGEDRIAQIVSLSTEETRFMAALMNASSSRVGNAIAYTSSDDYIREKLSDYIKGFLRSLLSVHSIRPTLRSASFSTGRNEQLINPIFSDETEIRRIDLSSMSSYQLNFVRSWLSSTLNSRVWIQRVSPSVAMMICPSSHMVAIQSTKEGTKWDPSRLETIISRAASAGIEGIQNLLHRVETEVGRIEEALSEARIARSSQLCPTVDIVDGDASCDGRDIPHRAT
uniref:UDENN domain-containing protein n=1 Tax=Compsopogon caeruleus TaxID=31354 RepID=A0A7S1XEE7_9RHOD|mmetsp:Transcript_17203/g.35746  ORF Transcript_17203/g.35746 Transcript_17203/m.35746 type:complete len:622 (+) Transcript_17203:327-2192(+)|eukprot:CAMPEP_0184687874 /NCGR_PEP_ID=MMETSP0312-20130426/27826_1 /TAXON_ID=31354 /ORGANISM="Compsopogon coeruleus, Strain SAG 36.94" /LENGTH=621 /DNA_ID=CAMNT_0027144443 /DNA_START=236 /DNA_END=2101 /DNA_ORIENTATION=-